MTSSKKIRTNYILIDYENVPSAEVVALKEDHFNVYLFVGAKQPKLGTGIVKFMRDLGPSRSEYIFVNKTGQNALDFHIAYVLGRLVEKDPTGRFHIISKDKGYQPLIDHMKEGGINICRKDSTAQIPNIRRAQNNVTDPKLKAVIKNLKGRGSAKPRKEATLKNTIRSMPKLKLSESEITQIVKTLIKSKFIKLNGKTISYALPA